MGDNKTVSGYNAGEIGKTNPEILVKPMRELITLYEEGKIKPEIYAVLSFEEVRRFSFVVIVLRGNRDFDVNQLGNFLLRVSLFAISTIEHSYKYHNALLSQLMVHTQPRYHSSEFHSVLHIVRSCCHFN